MLRRAFAFVLIAAGCGLLLHAIPQVPGAPRPAGTLVIVTAGGLTLSIVALVRRQMALRPSLRATCCVLAAMLAALLVGLRYYIGRSLLPSAPLADVELRESLLAWQRSLTWLSLGVVYVALAVAALPASAASASSGARRKRVSAGRLPSSSASIPEEP